MMPTLLPRLLVLACLLASLAGMRAGWAAELPPMALGVFPISTARQVVEIYQPVADALSKQLHRKVLIYTARDYRTFVERSSKGQYDLMLAPPHFAWLARQNAGYRPVFKYRKSIHGQLIVRHDSPLKQVENLRDGTLAIADPLALVALASQAQLAAHGLRSGIDYQTTLSATHINAAMHVINEEADGAIVGSQAFSLMRPDLRRQLRMLDETPPLPGLIYLVHPRLNDAELQAVERAFRTFSNVSGTSVQPHVQAHGDIVQLDGTEMQAIQPYAMQIQNLLEGTP